MLHSHQYKGFFLALTAAMMWGVSGTCVQFLFQHRGINTEWLVTVRLLISGMLLLCYAGTQKHTPVFEIWKNRHDRLSILIFSILGMLAVQYLFCRHQSFECCYGNYPAISGAGDYCGLSGNP